ncbi:PREDICTED: spectrin beta chain, non-erythrocytic 1-like isoform X2 [Priapulus caudatus]|uniref:Spectrin beta chain, non-erythrocytic 1-like isoform X2 n=1 Tax=Priapulus caudatus TaxID=37621 RepID=A0ABM1EFP6_PRICU|nr:PREDICTED: spectrin beta chain, non-erythrocytic 1-like isoform X2 [Priapulus caudatus]
MSMAEHMLSQQHFASDDVQDHLNTLVTSLQRLKESSADRQRRLLDAVESQTFFMRAKETEQWLSEKSILINNTDLGKDEDDTELMLGNLGTLDLDIENYGSNIKELKALTHGLVQRKHFDMQRIQKQQEDIDESYKALKSMSKNQRKALQGQMQMLKFQHEADDFEEWITEKEQVASSRDMGTDLEHVLTLQKKHELFMLSLNNFVTRQEEVKNLGTEISELGHPQADVVNARCAQLDDKWKAMLETANERLKALQGAEKIHVFDHDVEDTIDWIEEKEAILASEDLSADLDIADKLQRKYETFERDLVAIGKQVHSLTPVADDLYKQFPDAREHVETYHTEAVQAWNELQEKAAQRKQKLTESHNLQSYFDNYRELMTWIYEMTATLTMDMLPHDVAGAEALVKNHKEHKLEIDIKMNDFKEFTGKGEALINQTHVLSHEIQEKIDRINTASDQLLDVWQKQAVLYDCNLDAQLFNRDAEQLHAWMRTREPALKDTNYGGSMREVDELVKKQDDFQKTVDAQLDKVNALKRQTLLEKAFQEKKEIEIKQREKEKLQKKQSELESLRLVAVEPKPEEHAESSDDTVKSTESDGQPDSPESVRILQQPFVKPDVKEASMTMSLLQDEQATQYIGTDVHTEKEVVGSFPTEKHEHVELTPRPDVNDARRTSPEKPEQPFPPARFAKTEAPQKSSGSPKFTPVKKTGSHRRERAAAPSFQIRKTSVPITPEKLNKLHPIVKEGYLQRKHVYHSRRKKATIRSWKHYYVVLSGDLLAFLKTKGQYEAMQTHSTFPLLIHKSRVTVATDYTKHKHVFRLLLADNAEYLFQAPDENEMRDWIDKIQMQSVLMPEATGTLLETLTAADEYKELGSGLGTESLQASPRPMGGAQQQRKASDETAKNSDSGPGRAVLVVEEGPQRGGVTVLTPDAVADGSKMQDAQFTTSLMASTGEVVPPPRAIGRKQMPLPPPPQACEHVASEMDNSRLESPVLMPCGEESAPSAVESCKLDAVLDIQDAVLSITPEDAPAHEEMVAPSLLPHQHGLKRKSEEISDEDHLHELIEIDENQVEFAADVFHSDTETDTTAHITMEKRPKMDVNVSISPIDSLAFEPAITVKEPPLSHEPPTTVSVRPKQRLQEMMPSSNFNQDHVPKVHQKDTLAPESARVLPKEPKPGISIHVVSASGDVTLDGKIRPYSDPNVALASEKQPSLWMGPPVSGRPVGKPIKSMPPIPQRSVKPQSEFRPLFAESLSQPSGSGEQAHTMPPSSKITMSPGDRAKTQSLGASGGTGETDEKKNKGSVLAFFRNKNDTHRSDKEKKKQSKQQHKKEKHKKDKGY